MTHTVLEILKVGLSGLAFLLSGYGYQLLSNEQKKKTPSPATLRTIQRFIWQNIFFAIVVGAFSLVPMLVSQGEGSCGDSLQSDRLADCRRSLSELDTFRQVDHPVSDLKAAIVSHLARCSSLLKAQP